jgi:hypothetical protein
MILLLIEYLIKYREGLRRKKEDNMSLREGWGCSHRKRRRWNRHRRSIGRGRRTLRKWNS